MKRAIIEYPDPRLARVCAPVELFDDELQRLIQDMRDTIGTALGLSACQVGENRRLLLLNFVDDPSVPEVFVNPELAVRAGLGFVEESCLSVPGQKVNVWRATFVRVRAQDAHGAPFEADLRGLAAVCLQHEMDHLDGKLIVDHMNFVRRYRFARRAAAMA
jgi:peptide deformylase